MLSSSELILLCWHQSVQSSCLLEYWDLQAEALFAGLEPVHEQVREGDLCPHWPGAQPYAAYVQKSGAACDALMQLPECQA